jgi:Baseplate J-like protein
MTNNTQITLPYSQRDPNAVLTELQQQLSTISNGEWTDFLNSDLGYALVKSAVAINDFSSFFTDQQAAETFLSLCVFRESAVRRAKELNYPIYRATPATCSVQLTVPSFNHAIIVPANTTWTIQGIPFTCTDEIIINPGQTSLNISLTQGTFYTVSITSPGLPWYKITVPTNASEIVVKVNNVIWASTDTWIGVTDFHTYKLYEDTTGQTISFGANINTLIPPTGSNIGVTAILTLGAEGNIQTSGINVVPLTQIIDPQSGLPINNSISATTLTAALGGLDIEPISSIQANAPGFYGTQGRAVTALDWESLVLNVSGVKDCSIVGGENLGFYSYIFITVYGDDPYNVSPNLLTEIKNALFGKAILTLKPILQAPVVIEVQMSLDLGIINNSYPDAQAAENLVNTNVNNFINKLRIGVPMYNSALLATIQNTPGIAFGDVTFTLDSFATSTAGKIAIPIVSNIDLTNVILKDVNNNVLFSGDGTSMVENGLFTFLHSLPFTDQKCTLSYNTTTTDIDLSTNQVLVLTKLNITANFVSGG